MNAPPIILKADASMRGFQASIEQEQVS